MRIAFFNTKPYDRRYFTEANKKYNHEIVFLRPRLSHETCALAKGFKAVCAFVNDELDQGVIDYLHKEGVGLIALRCAGFNNADLKAVFKHGITLARVPAYSAHGVAEHAVALIMALNRKIYRSHQRIREGNFLLEGLLGFELNGRTVGVVGTGQIGRIFANIMLGFGCKILASDPYPNKELKNTKGVEYCTLNNLYRHSDIISLHAPLTPKTVHMINRESLEKMKPGVMLINTSRGALVDTKAVISALKTGKLGFLGLDVYEEEADVVFEDLSGKIIQDDVLARLMIFPNVLMTGHQAFFTETALKNIAETTLQNISGYEQEKLDPANLVTEDLLK